MRDLHNVTLGYNPLTELATAYVAQNLLDEAKSYRQLREATGSPRPPPWLDADAFSAARALRCEAPSDPSPALPDRFGESRCSNPKGIRQRCTPRTLPSSFRGPREREVPAPCRRSALGSTRSRMPSAPPLESRTSRRSRSRSGSRERPGPASQQRSPFPWPGDHANNANATMATNTPLPRTATLLLRTTSLISQSPLEVATARRRRLIRDVPTVDWK